MLFILLVGVVDALGNTGSSLGLLSLFLLLLLRATLESLLARLFLLDEGQLWVVAEPTGGSKKEKGGLREKKIQDKGVVFLKTVFSLSFKHCHPRSPVSALRFHPHHPLAMRLDTSMSISCMHVSGLRRLRAAFWSFLTPSFSLALALP